jgi:hypothetical protein
LLESCPERKRLDCKTRVLRVVIDCAGSPNLHVVGWRAARALFGYALDPGPRDPNEWRELHYEDPPTGVVRLKGVRLRDLEDDDSDLDPEITFSIEELWSADCEWRAGGGMHGPARLLDDSIEPFTLSLAVLR